MKKKFVILSIILSFILSCSVMAAPSSPTASPIPPSKTPQTAIAIPPTSTVMSPTQPASSGTIALDFVALLCDAKWMNGAQHLTACPDVNADRSGGYATLLDPVSEGLPANTPVLLTFAGTISAALFLRYPTFTVHAGDHFRATLRCQTNSQCDVQFALEYYDAQGKYHSPFLQWDYKVGDAVIHADADLSSLVGQSVDFVLALRPENGTLAQDDGALWIAPHIYRPKP